MQTGIVTKTLSVNTGRLTGIDRSCAITQIFCDTQSSAATDNIVSSGTNETLVGRTNGGDFYTIQRSGTLWQKINSSVNV